MLVRDTGPGTYVPAIDGLRAVAVAAVMLFHLIPAALPGGFVGVDVFFVISGFVVTRSMARDIDLPLVDFLTAFYARRVRRIVPALLVCLAVTMLVGEALIPSAWLSQMMQKTGCAAFVGLSNFVLAFLDDGYFATRSTHNPFTHTWSLAVEEQFYVVFPIIFFAAFRTFGQQRPNATIAVVAALSLLSLAFAAVTTHAYPAISYYMLPSRFWELGAGAIAALAHAHYRGQPSRTVSEVGGFVGMALIAAGAIFADATAFPFPWAIPVVLGAVMLTLLSAWQAHSIVLRTLSSRPMVVTGLASYSLYLWHWPVYTVMRWTSGLDSPATYAIALGVTIVLATISYRFVEKAFRGKHVTARRANGRVVLAGAAASVIGAGLGVAIYATPSVFSLTTVQAQRDDWYPELARIEPETTRCAVETEQRSDEHLILLPVRCRGGASPKRLYVLGDSHADAYRRMLQAFVGSSGMRTDVYSVADCPWAPIFRASAGESIECKRAKRDMLAEIDRAAPPGSIVFLASLRLPRLSDQFALTEAQRAELARYRSGDTTPGLQDARQIVEMFDRKGLITIIDLPLPVFPAPAFRCSDWFNRSNPICAGGLIVPRADLIAFRQPVVDALDSLRASSNRLHLWDPFPILCPDGRPCAAVRDGRPLYFDGDHISGHGNDLLAPGFTRAVNAAQ